ncbi:FixH family protein [Shimazuella sp. AN120528]|uniref:FixH family protein n=1 Tax=Shimazuella soli TaxID=1892854 RepID=UPI001F0DEFB9|nr:FixH family protein [Shimazuella soli]MCH5585892.1 FixH family protein [Shimazuella soli]
MKKIGWMLSLGLLLVSGCTSPSTTSTRPSAPTSISLQFEVQPTKPIPNQPVTLSAKVTGNNKPVNDANVEFEIWNKEAKSHSMLKTKQTAEGTYTITNTYPIAGTYNVIVHATTPQVHQMLSKTFTIGETSNKEQSHHSGDNGLMMHIQLPSNAKSGQSTKLFGHIAQNNQALTGANVEFEIWKEGESNHDFTDVAETKPGEYYSTYHFKTPGTYHIKLHVEKGKIHDHTEQLLIVK